MCEVKPSNPASGIIGRRVGPEPADESAHFEVCDICGQAVDMRNLAQVLHHYEPEHTPIRLDA